MPTIENTNYHEVQSYKGVEENSKIFLEGTVLEYTCAKNFTQLSSNAICNNQGEWIHEIVCYPGILVL